MIFTKYNLRITAWRSWENEYPDLSIELEKHALGLLVAFISLHLLIMGIINVPSLGLLLFLCIRIHLASPLLLQG